MMHVTASGNSLSDGHTMANRQIPAPEALRDKLGYVQTRSTNVAGNLFLFSHRLQSCRS